MADNEVSNFDIRAFALQKAIDTRPILLGESEEPAPEAIVERAKTFLAFLEG